MLRRSPVVLSSFAQGNSLSDLISCSCVGLVILIHSWPLPLEFLRYIIKCVFYSFLRVKGYGQVYGLSIIVGNTTFV